MIKKNSEAIMPKYVSNNATVREKNDFFLYEETNCLKLVPQEFLDSLTKVFFSSMDKSRRKKSDIDKKVRNGEVTVFDSLIVSVLR